MAKQTKTFNEATLLPPWKKFQRLSQRLKGEPWFFLWENGNALHQTTQTGFTKESRILSYAGKGLE